MMKEQTPDFILGYLFSEIERKVIKDLTARGPIGGCPPGAYVAQVPLLWFGIKDPRIVHAYSPVTQLAEEVAEKLDMTLQDVVTKKLFRTVVVQDKQYFRFVTTMVEDEDRKKMTLSQIENELGYKIAIVSEENK